MTNNWAIVAIPEKDDSVWKYSSEKVPHLTILSLGEHEAGPLSAKILSYLEHACEVMLHRFSMYSDERTELGPKKADVILFEKTRADQAIVQFRDALLKDPDVLEWFHTSPQFPEWTPHLTMGFPETPAREDTRDYPGTHSVRFDRIALWTGDYDGPEIKLKSYEPTDLLMSDIQTSIDLSQKVTDIDVLHRPMAEFDETKVKRGKGGKFATKTTISDTDANLVEDDLAWEQGDSQKFIKEYMISTNAKALEALAKKTLVPLGYKVDDSWESDPKAVAAVSKNAVAYMNKMASTQGTNPSGTKRISYSLKGNDLVTSVVSYSGPKPASPYRPPTLPIKKFDTGLPKHKSGPMFNPAATIDTSRISDASDAKHSDLIDQLDLSQTLVHADTGLSVQDVLDDMTDGERELMDLIVGAAIEDLELPDEYLEPYNLLSDDMKNLLNFTVGVALSDDFEMQHDDGLYINSMRLDESIAGEDAVQYGKKGMHWGVITKSDGTTYSRRTDRRANKFEKKPSEKTYDSLIRSASRDKVKSGTASLAVAHVAALKSTGHRVLNAVVGDKTYMKRSLAIAGVTLAGLGASFAVPAVLPASALTAVAAHLGGAFVGNGVIIGGQVLTSSGHIAATTLGAQILTSIGVTASLVGNQVANAANVVDNTVRAVRGNKRVLNSYAKLGNTFAATQYDGSKAVQKVLNQSGGIAKKRLRHEDIPGISLDQTMGEMEIKPNLQLMHFLEHHDMELVMLDGAEWVAVTDAVHFGRKGMKWGVRHKRGSDGTVTDSVSSDAQQVAALKAKVAKAGGTHTLTNDELTTLKKRISLENEYAKATGTDKSTLDRRHAKIKKAVDLGKTANDLYSFYNSDVGKMLRSLVMDVPDGSSGGGGKKGGGEKDNSNTEGSGGSKKGRGPRSQGPARTKLLYDATRLGRTSPGFSSPYKTTGNPFIRPARKRHTVRGVVYGVTDLK